MAAENLVGLGPGQGRAVSSVIREEPATPPRPAAPEQPTGTSARAAEPKPGTPRLCRPDSGLGPAESPGTCAPGQAGGPGREGLSRSASGPRGVRRGVGWGGSRRRVAAIGWGTCPGAAAGGWPPRLPGRAWRLRRAAAGDLGGRAAGCPGTAPLPRRPPTPARGWRAVGTVSLGACQPQ